MEGRERGEGVGEGVGGEGGGEGGGGEKPSIGDEREGGQVEAAAGCSLQCWRMRMRKNMFKLILLLKKI